MVERLFPGPELNIEVKSPETAELKKGRSELRARALSVLDEARHSATDTNPYQSKSVVPMAGSAQTIRRSRRRGALGINRRLGF